MRNKPGVVRKARHQVMQCCLSGIFVFRGGDGRFFEMIVKKCKEDAEITMHPENGPEVKRKYRDLSSVEILFL
jgi:hypothetical protein